MLDYLSADHDVERFAAQTLENGSVCWHHFKPAIGIGFPCERDSAVTQIDADDFAASGHELAGGKSVTATDIEHAHTRSKLARPSKDRRQKVTVHVRRCLRAEFKVTVTGLYPLLRNHRLRD